MIGAILDGLRGVFRFGGRTGVNAFWPYAWSVVGLFFIGNFAIMLPTMATTFAKMHAFAAAHPEQATIQASPGGYSISIKGNHPELMPDVGALSQGLSVLIGLAVVLFAAAVTRRLHDRAWPGFLGLLPLPFLGVGLVMFPKMMAGALAGDFDGGLFGLMFLNNLLYLGALALLVFLLAGKGTEGPNRYGPAPA